MRGYVRYSPPPTKATQRTQARSFAEEESETQEARKKEAIGLIAAGVLSDTTIPIDTIVLRLHGLIDLYSVVSDPENYNALFIPLSPKSIPMLERIYNAFHHTSVLLDRYDPNIMKEIYRIESKSTNHNEISIVSDRYLSERSIRNIEVVSDDPNTKEVTRMSRNLMENIFSHAMGNGKPLYQLKVDILPANASEDGKRRYNTSRLQVAGLITDKGDDGRHHPRPSVSGLVKTYLSVHSVRSILRDYKDSQKTHRGFIRKFNNPAKKRWATIKISFVNPTPSGTDPMNVKVFCTKCPASKESFVDINTVKDFVEKQGCKSCGGPLSYEILDFVPKIDISIVEHENKKDGLKGKFGRTLVGDDAKDFISALEMFVEMASIWDYNFLFPQE